jgi:phosphatidylglycerol:prolipoprotein diacylglycerol transferase
LFLAIGFIAAIALLERRAARHGIPAERMMDLGLLILVVSVAGSRLFFVASHWADYTANPLSALAVWDGGLTFYGGLIAALLVTLLFLRSHRIPFWQLADLATPSFALGLGFGRIGCFFSGCCFGMPTAAPWGVRFPSECAAGYTFGGPIHPTQLYEALFGFAACILLLLWRPKRAFPGATICLFLLLYAAWRFGIDFIRYYEPSQYWLGLTNNQWVSVAMACFAITSGIVLHARMGDGSDRRVGTPQSA